MITFLNEMGGRGLEILGWATLQNTIFLALVFLILHLLKGASARVKHSIALLGLLKLLLPPFLPLPGLSAASVTTNGAGGAPEGFTLNWLPSTTVASMPIPEFLGPAGAVLGIWIFGVAVALLLPALSSLRLWRDLHRAEAVAARDEDLDPGVRIFLCEKLGTPMTFGLFSRRIYVPPSWNSWSPERQSMVLRHEQAHIRRGDGFVLLLQALARALHFFNPLAHLLGRRLQEYREMVCDDRSIETGRDSPVSYSRHLVEIAEDALSVRGPCESATALLRRRNELLKRVEYQMKGGSMASRFQKPSLWMIAALTLLWLPLSWYPTSEAGEVKTKVKLETASKVEKSAKVTLKTNGDMDLDGEATDLLRLSRVFSGFGEADPSKVVIDVFCEDGVTLGRLHEFQKLLQEKQIDQVRYHGNAGQELPLKLLTPELKKKYPVSENYVVILTLGASGEMILDGKEIPAKELTRVLAKEQGDTAEIILVVHFKPQTPYSTLVTAMEAAKKAGIEKIALSPPKGL